MNKNKEIDIESIINPIPTAEEVQAEVDDLYNELERRYGPGFADSIIRHYTDVKPGPGSEGK